METQIIYAFWARDFLSLHYLFTLQASSSLSCRGSCWKGPWQPRVPALAGTAVLRMRDVSARPGLQGGTDNLARASWGWRFQFWEIQSFEQNTFRPGQCLEWNPLKNLMWRGVRARAAAAWGQLGP